MKIFMATSTFPPYRGGIGNVAFYEAVGLAALGDDVTVLTPLYGPVATAPGPAAENAFEIRRVVPLWKYGNAACCPAIAAALREADVAYLQYPFFGTAELIALGKAFKRRPPLTVRYNMDVVGTGLKRVIFRLHNLSLLRFIMRQADMVIFSTRDYAARSDASFMLRASPERCAVVSYGVDMSRFYPEPGSGKKRLQFLFVGGLDSAHYFKGLEYLLRAIAAVHEACDDIRLVVVGGGNQLEKYRALSARLAIASRVFFAGPCDDAALRRLYSASLFTVLPSVDRSESFGLVVLESMACGTAVIASDLPGVRTLINDGVNGYLIRSCAQGRRHDKVSFTEMIASTLRRALGNIDRAEEMGRQALETARTRYEWAGVTRQLHGLLARLGRPA